MSDGGSDSTPDSAGPAESSGAWSAQVWDGEQGEVWVANHARLEEMLGRFTPGLLTAAAIKPDDAVVDVGCGCGETTVQAAGAARSGRVLGVDLSAPMLARARQLAAAQGADNVVFEQADAEVYPFPGASFDTAISRFGLMFFNDPPVAFANIGRALRPGGRLGFLSWQALERNEQVALPLRVAAAQGVPVSFSTGAQEPGPFSLADPERIRDLLGEAGFGGIRIEPVEQRLRVGDDADDVLAFYRTQPMAKTCMQAAPAELAERVLEAIRAALVPHESAEGLFLDSAAWLVSAHW